MAGIAVPDPVIISLDLLGNGVINHVGRSEFRMSAVMAPLAVNLAAHLGIGGVGQDGITEKRIAVFLVLGIMAVTTTWLLKPGLTAFYQ